MIVAIWFPGAVRQLTGVSVPAVIAHTFLRVLIARSLAIACQTANTRTAVTLTVVSVIAWVQSGCHIGAVALVINALSSFTARILTVHTVCTVVVTPTHVARVSAHGRAVAGDLARSAHPATLTVTALWDIVGCVAVSAVVAVFGAVGFLTAVSHPALSADAQAHDSGGRNEAIAVTRTVNAVQSWASSLIAEVTASTVEAAVAGAVYRTVADTVAQLFTVEAMVARFAHARVINDTAVHACVLARVTEVPDATLAPGRGLRFAVASSVGGEVTCYNHAGSSAIKH